MVAFNSAINSRFFFIFSASSPLSSFFSSSSFFFSHFWERERESEREMKNSVSDRSLFIHSEDEEGDDHDLHGGEEVGGGKNSEDGDGHESDGSDASSSSSPRHSGSRPNSYAPSWPQSYRQSIDMYTGATPPAIGILGNSLSRLSSSFLTSSFKGKQTPDIFTSLIKPLLPTTDGDVHHQQLHDPSLSIHSLPSRKPSLEKIQEDTPSALPPSRNSSFGQAVFNGMNVLIGVGILSAPYAVQQGGWLGLLLLLAFAAMSLYTGFLLRRCLDSKEGLETYPDIGQAAFGTYGRITVSIILYVELYACCVEYIILESDNLSVLFPNAHLDIGNLHLDAHILFAIITTFIVLPTTWLRDLSILSYISVGGVIASIVIVFCLFWVGAINDVGFVNKGSLLNLSGMPIAIGLYGYCYSGHSVFPNIYSSLKDRNQFPSILYTCFAICTVMFAGSAVMGYTMFGELIQSQFTLNLPNSLVASKIAIWTTVVNPITKYALILTPLAMALEELLPSNHQKSPLYPILIRSTLVFSTLAVGLSVPFFGLVLSLIGSLLTMLVTFIVPCACFLYIFKGKVTRLQVFVCILTILVGIVSCVIGTYSSVSEIIKKLNSG